MSYIEVNMDGADALLDRLPGGRELYEDLADVFLAAYFGHSVSEVVETPPGKDGEQ